MDRPSRRLIGCHACGHSSSARPVNLSQHGRSWTMLTSPQLRVSTITEGYLAEALEREIITLTIGPPSKPSTLGARFCSSRPPTDGQPAPGRVNGTMPHYVADSNLSKRNTATADVESLTELVLRSIEENLADGHLMLQVAVLSVLLIRS